MPESFPLDVDALLSVLNYLNMGVYITDRERRILLWNRKAEEITGYSAESVVGKACHEQVLNHVDKDNHPLCSTDLCPLHRAISLEKESDEPVLVYAKRADGRRVAVSVSVAPLRDADGKVVGGIETFRDETSRIRDLEFAKTIQRNLLPGQIPEPVNLRFDVRYYPHDLVGGDFYDIFPVGENRYGFFVADVRGHGVSAALYTMWLKSLAESHRDLAAQPGEFMSALNRDLSKFVVDESFATAFYGVADDDRSTVTYANAGHPAPLHFHADRDPDEFEVHGMPLGIVGDESYGTSTASLSPGDLLLSFTDGVTEARDRQDNMLGTKGLVELVTRLLPNVKRDLLEHIYQHIKRACGDILLDDDVLLLSLWR